MDFTEIPHAEDFAFELGELITEYKSRGLDEKIISRILESELDELVFDEMGEDYD